MRSVLITVAVVTPLVLASTAAATADYDEQRTAMLDRIKRLFTGGAAVPSITRLDPSVAEALGSVRRHRFVPEGRRDAAYKNRPLPIGYGQTISQPYIVALMSQLLALEETDRVLELGTGSGYQAAIASEIAAHVYSIEIIPELAERSSKALQQTGHANVTVKNADGYHGWPAHAPFDAIVITAAVDHVPPPLLKQLTPGGRLVLPLGDPFASQVLTLVQKKENGQVRSRQIMPVRFVPLTRGDPD